MKSLWKTEKFEENDFLPPKDIVEEQFKFLEEYTDGKVIGRIKEYEGEYQDKYGNDSSLFSVNSSIYNKVMVTVPDKSFDVQSILGEQSEFVYEFYLTSVETPKYKYRMGIIDYSVLFYPAHLTLELSLAKEINVDTWIEVSSQEEFVDILSKILNSTRVNSVIANLLRMNGLNG